MKRASTDKGAKRGSGGGTSSSQRLATAGVRALEAHTRVRRFAERLGEELEDAELPHDAPPLDLDPDDPVVVAVEKATSTMRAVTTSMAAVSETATTAAAAADARVPSTKLGVAPPPSKPLVKTKLGVGSPPKRTETDDE